MHTLDWIVTLLPLLIVLIVGLKAQKYVNSVADFMAANRSAGRYLLCISGAELQTGAVVFVALFEAFSHGGFAYNWWSAIGTPLALILGVTGFVTYRYRETRALTLGQFFEIRYNKSFRLFTGLLGLFAGILNFGVIPAIGARTLVYFLALPETVRVFSVTVPTYVPLMGLFLTITLFVALSGGVITVMMINTLEGIMSQIFFLIIIFTVLWMFSWSQMRAVLLARPPGHSLVDPFDTSGVRDFNIWYILMGLFAVAYGTMAWQNSGAYKSAALTAHEGRMAGILSNWQGMGKTAVITLLALAAVTYLHHPDFAAGAARVQATVHQITNQQAREEMEAPIALAYLLPVGVKGLFCAILLMGIFGGDATHLHSWGSIFVQDFLVPLRRKPFGPRMHLFILRLSILGVACFAFLFGIFFHLTDYIIMWFGVTTAIFTGGAGSAIIGGLYWKKGNAYGAWAGFITGSVLAVGGIVAQQVATHYYDQSFFLNGVQIAFSSSIAAVFVYVTVSLLTYKEDFNIERMLHRGQYAAIQTLMGDTPIEHQIKKPGWIRFIGFDDNFTRGDKWIAGSVIAWGMSWFAVFVVISLWNLAAPWSTESWATYYHFTGISLPVFFAVVTGVWFTWGGVKDMHALFLRLREQRGNSLDDGTVINNQNLDELAIETKTGDKGPTSSMPSMKNK
jgi:SSS family solute:Na+ symporter